MRDLLTRRHLLSAAAALAVPQAAFAQAELAPTPACHDHDPPTVRETEGPFFKPSSPQRADLREPGMAGRPLDLSGFVLNRACRPIAGALIDAWQADDTGRYDNAGFRLRGHLFTDADGRFRLRTIVPGAYAGRTRHIHVKVQPAGGRLLTTQLYFPDEPLNRSDGLFRRELTMRLARNGDLTLGRFDFVLDLG
ncbi:MAG TPA: intradiol ring-cleavage dioxygenase [Xanthobacteraceae bacterium]|jgi:protocatechuate 3,4-dioxygenase beta subunit|nr:intradiol ring-cleavage dioxygenase [Xanthobacteraceae bacterium]